MRLRNVISTWHVSVHYHPKFEKLVVELQQVKKQKSHSTTASNLFEKDAARKREETHFIPELRLRLQWSHPPHNLLFFIPLYASLLLPANSPP